MLGSLARMLSLKLIGAHTLGFGFAAALVESLPIIGLFFSVSNRIGAAMWAFGRTFFLARSDAGLITAIVDLEKRQHFVADEKRKRLQ